MDTPLPPPESRARMLATAELVRDLADLLTRHSDEPDGDGWGATAAETGRALMQLGRQLADSGAAVAVLEGQSARTVATILDITNSAVPRRLAGTPELAAYAEETDYGLRVTQGGIARARYDLRHDSYTYAQDAESVQTRVRRR